MLAANTEQRRSGVKQTLAWLLGFIALVLGLFLYNFLVPKALSPDVLKSLGYYSYEKPREIDDFKLVNHLGETVSKEHFRGYWTLVFFGFTLCPDVCPTTLGVLNRAVIEMERPPQVIMISVDPERDTVTRLRQYVPSFNKNFIGFTGEFDQIASLATQLYIAFGKMPGEEPGTYTVDHSSSIVVFNPQAQHVGFIKAPHQALKITKIVSSLMR